MSASAEIAKVGTWHESLIAYIVANPSQRRSEVARHFQVSPAWLSTVINSDVFQARLRERQDEFFGAATAPIRERLEGIAHLAIDRMEDKLPFENDLSEIREVAKLALTSLGFGNGANGKNAPGPHMVQNNNFYSVPSEVINAARERILNQQGTLLENVPEKHLPAPEGVQAGNGRTMGPALENRPAVREDDQETGPEARG